MKLVYKTKYLEDFYKEELEFFKSVFSIPSIMGEEKYKSLLLAHFEVLEKHKITYFLLDITESQYVVNIELQDWIRNLFYPIYKEIGLKKWAIVASKDFIVSLSVEQIIDEYPPHTMDINYFYTQNEAMEWLFE